MLGAGAASLLCTWWRQGAGAVCRVRAVSWLETGCRCWVGAGCRCWCWCCELAVCTQHHTVLSLERSLSIGAVGYLPSSGSVLADSCVKGCAASAHTFVGIMLYAQRQALNRPLVFAVCAHTLARINLYAQDHIGLMVLQIVASSMLQNQQWRWILLGLGPMTLTGFAVCAHTFVCINFFAQDRTL